MSTGGPSIAMTTTGYCTFPSPGSHTYCHEHKFTCTCACHTKPGMSEEADTVNAASDAHRDRAES